MSAPAVDVGIAAWGHSPYLGEAVASVQKQTLASWRLHVLQDGPPETSVETLLDGDSRIVYSATGQPGGAPRSKTHLIRSGNARYVALLDHDDVWEPDFLRPRVAFLDAHPNCAFVFSPSLTIDAHGRSFGRTARMLPDGVHTSDELVGVLLRAGGIPGGTVVVRRSAYEALGEGFCEALPRTYDYEMWIRLALRFPAGYLGRYDVRWRRHRRNASSEFAGYEEEYRLLMSRLRGLLGEERPDLASADALLRRRVSDLLLMRAVDTLELHQRRVAWRFLGGALELNPRSAFDARAAAVLFGIVFGRPAAALVARARTTRRRARSRLPYPSAGR
jgi:glycosyltransferase involved in cell wall biosynthesis